MHALQDKITAVTLSPTASPPLPMRRSRVSPCGSGRTLCALMGKEVKDYIKGKKI